jgi:hypothetical protein
MKYDRIEIEIEIDGDTVRYILLHFVMSHDRCRSGIGQK